MTQDDLKSRKLQLVRDSIDDAAVELFAAKGFSETTVEEIAKAAGVSRRTFFRYFTSKDDLLSQAVLALGTSLSAAIATSPAAYSPLEVVRETVLAEARRAVAHPHTRPIIEIALRSPNATQAYGSRMIEAELAVAQAYAKRLKCASEFDLKPRLLAGLTFTILNGAIMSWYQGDYQDISTAVRQGFNHLNRFIND